MVISELQASLIGAGVAAIAVIFAYNKWQETRHRRLAEKIFRPDHPDVLLEGGDAQDGERLEPSLIDTPAPGAARVQSAAPKARPSAAAPQPAERAEPLVPAAEIVEPPLTLAGENTDIVVRLDAAEPVPAPLLWPAQHDALPRLSKPILWFGLNEKKGDWDALSAHSAGRYRRLRAALQLVDRHGPVADADVNTFLAGVSQLAEHFHAEVRLPDLGEVPLLAQELDQFCAGVDVQIGVNVVTKEGASITGTKLRGLAEASGFSLQGDGAFHYQDELGRTLFSLGAMDGQVFSPDTLRTQSLQGLTLSLDVPRVPEGAQAFVRMNVVAQQLAQAVNGHVVDDNRAPVDERAVGIIRGKIAEFQQAMAQRDIEAGGPLALRLFS